MHVELHLPISSNIGSTISGFAFLYSLTLETNAFVLLDTFVLTTKILTLDGTLLELFTS